MTTLSCRYLTRDCVDVLSAEDSTEIQKVFLVHVHTKHQMEWNQLSSQSKSVSIVDMRNRFLHEAEEGVKTAIVS